MNRLSDAIDSCHAETTRGGQRVPCDGPAVAVGVNEEGGWYPVCPHHTRARAMAPLREVIDTARNEGATAVLEVRHRNEVKL